MVRMKKLKNWWTKTFIPMLKTNSTIRPTRNSKIYKVIYGLMKVRRKYTKIDGQPQVLMRLITIKKMDKWRSSMHHNSKAGAWHQNLKKYFRQIRTIICWKVTTLSQVQLLFKSKVSALAWTLWNTTAKHSLGDEWMGPKINHLLKKCSFYFFNCFSKLFSIKLNVLLKMSKLNELMT